MGAAEPGWQATATDSEVLLQAAGGVGLQSYLSGSSTGAPVLAKFDDFALTSVQTP